MTCSNNRLNKEVSIEYPLFQSQKGRYFIGETPILTGDDSHAVAALVNPVKSNVTIYLNAITVTNISSENVSAEVYLNSSSPKTLPSPYVSCTNSSIYPPPTPNGQIQSLPSVSSDPKDGVKIFGRIAGPYSTLVMDGSQIILAPGSCVLIYLGGYLPVQLDSAIVAFGWWEENIMKPCTYI